MPADYLLSPTQFLTLAELGTLLASRVTIRLADDAKTRLQAGHAYLRRRLEQAPTLLGDLFQLSAPPGASRRAPDQPPPASLLLAHAGGIGAEVPAELVRLMLLLKARSLSYGHSGVAPATVQRLLDMYNRELYPVVYEQGATGIFGDSSALAHLGLPLLLLGEVNYQGYRLAAADALSLFSWAPLSLSAPEELALLSGTQFTLAYAVDAALRTERLCRAADVIGALSVTAFGGRLAFFEERLLRLRPHAGPGVVARRLRELLAGPELSAANPAGAELTPYSFRCVPQVHGASRDALAYVAQTIETECNSGTEALAIIPADDLLLGSGNFHGQPLALALDHLALAVAGLGSISERRTGHVLAAGPGQESGLPYSAASLVGQNKQLSTPASLDSGGPGRADHLSLSANAATKAHRAVENTEQLLGIELLAARQALARQQPGRLSEVLKMVLAAFGEAGPGGRQASSADLPAAASFVRRFDWP
ncbi:aromatic amino acid lyase [uncultured Hymenobacter sp.]|uniref:aromatic amino acid lyase n=1 Tax=uncultured Hymenobacter sp. TaxID=170016 RepID=UPI0035C9A0C4